jgi:hypothetical protein
MSATMSADHQPYVVVDSPHEVANWRPLVHWLLFVPHGIILNALRLVSNVVFIVYWFIVLFTRKPHPGLYGVMAMYERYNTRATGFLFGYSEIYAPFDFDTGTSDNGAYPPVRLNLPAPPAEVPRVKVLNFLLAIPHYIVVAIIGIAAVVVAVIGWFAVLFTGRWPAGMRAFLVRFANYYYRVWTYVAMVENDYPKFGLPAA